MDNLMEHYTVNGIKISEINTLIGNYIRVDKFNDETIIPKIISHKLQLTKCLMLSMEKKNKKTLNIKMITDYL